MFDSKYMFRGQMPSDDVQVVIELFPLFLPLIGDIYTYYNQACVNFTLLWQTLKSLLP